MKARTMTERVIFKVHISHPFNILSIECCADIVRKYLIMKMRRHTLGRLHREISCSPVIQMFYYCGANYCGAIHATQESADARRGRMELVRGTLSF
jgi:hypothetical protein